jgi:hypothetical protein
VRPAPSHWRPYKRADSCWAGRLAESDRLHLCPARLEPRAQSRRRQDGRLRRSTIAQTQAQIRAQVARDQRSGALGQLACSRAVQPKMTRQAVPSTNVPICASAGARTPLAASVGGSSRRCLPGLSSTTSAYSPHMPHTMDTRKANQAAANHATSPSMSLAIVIVTARIAALKVSSCRVTSIANSNAFSVRASTCGGGSPRAERILSAKQLTIREADRCWRRVRPLYG